MTAVKLATRFKHGPLTASARHGVLELQPGPSLVELVEARDRLRRVAAAVAGLSDLERQALRVLLTDGWPADKSLENALGRAQRKLRAA